MYYYCKSVKGLKNNQLNLQILCWVYTCTSSRNWHQMPLPSCPLFYCFLYQKVKRTRLFIFSSSLINTILIRKNEQIILISAQPFDFFSRLILLSYLPASFRGTGISLKPCSYSRSRMYLYSGPCKGPYAKICPFVARHTFFWMVICSLSKLRNSKINYEWQHIF